MAWLETFPICLVVIVVVVVVIVMAVLTRLFQFMTALFCLRTVFPMAVDGFSEVSFGLLDLAMAIVIAVLGLEFHCCPCHKRQGKD